VHIGIFISIILNLPAHYALRFIWLVAALSKIDRDFGPKSCGNNALSELCCMANKLVTMGSNS